LHVTGPDWSAIVHSAQGSLHVVNCRFVLGGSLSIVAEAPVCTVRNCEFAGSSNGGHFHVHSHQPNDGRITLDNNLFLSPATGVLGIEWHRPDLHNFAVRLDHNTVVTGIPFMHGLSVVPESARAGATPGRQPVRMHVSANVFDKSLPEDTFSWLLPPEWYHADAKPLSAAEAEQLLLRLMAWREERNLYGKGMTFQTIRRVTVPGKPEREEIDE